MRLTGGAGNVQVSTNLIVTECHRGFGVNYHCGDGIQSKFSGRLVSMMPVIVANVSGSVDSR